MIVMINFKNQQMPKNNIIVVVIIAWPAYVVRLLNQITIITHPQPYLQLKRIIISVSIVRCCKYCKMMMISIVRCCKYCKMMMISIVRGARLCFN